jgi:2-dehydro-3-deoxygalactonokinase
MQNSILSCDWGTSSFRLKLVNVEDQIVLSEVFSDEGTAFIYNKWLASQNQQFVDRLQYFQQHLKKNIDLLENKISASLKHIPLVVSGMASSSIGMKELAYASLPFPINGANAVFEKIGQEENFLHDIYLISGVRNENDVMRGEETQLIGLLEQLAFEVEDNVCIFPGTHSKHLLINNKKITDFRTFMTGEIFSLMTNHSILKDTIEKSNHSVLGEDDMIGLRLGIAHAGTSDLLNSLFSVRINQLFKKLNKHQNYYYLSGLLIGTELKSLSTNKKSKILLCSGSNVFELYRLTLKELDLLSRTTLISPEVMEKASVAGQVKMFLNYFTNNKKYEEK